MSDISDSLVNAFGHEDVSPSWHFWWAEWEEQTSVFSLVEPQLGAMELAGDRREGPARSWPVLCTCGGLISG